MNGQGWFADVDADDPKQGYQPCLQLDGVCHSLDVWFPTEADCLDYIRAQILGQGLMTSPSAPLLAKLRAVEDVADQYASGALWSSNAMVLIRRAIAEEAPES